MNRNIEIIFSDIDGTFLNSNHEVTQKTKKEVQRVVQNGIPFILISSRMPEAMIPIQKLAGFKGPMICYGGSLILDENMDIEYSEGISPDTALKVARLIESEFSRLTWNMYENQTWMCPDKNSQWIEREERNTGVQAVSGNAEEVLRWEKVHKILCMGEPDEILLLQKCLETTYPLLFSCRSSPDYLEITSSSVNKGIAIEIFCAARNIPIEHSLAFGDNYNDLHMLAKAGIGYVMENAPDEIKQRIGNVTASNDHDGIAMVLQYIPLKINSRS